MTGRARAQLKPRRVVAVVVSDELGKREHAAALRTHATRRATAWPAGNSRM
jgi:hypothetical protein